jgi:hypothetical protein
MISNITRSLLRARFENLAGVNGVKLLGSDGTAPLTYVSKRILKAFMVHRITLIVILQMPDPLRLSQISFSFSRYPETRNPLFRLQIIPFLQKGKFFKPGVRARGVRFDGVV